MALSGREAYLDELTRIAAQDHRVVCLARKHEGAGHPFEMAHSDRFFDLNGVEAAMASMARGLAVAGFRMFVCARPATDGRPVSHLGSTRAFLEAGATVVSSCTAWGEADAELRRLPGIAFALPCGEAETRAVIREAARSGRPHYIRVGARATAWPGPGGPPVGDEPLLLVDEAVDDPVDGPVDEPVNGPGGDATARDGGAADDGAADDGVCLVSVGEQGTEVASAVARTPGARHAHAHLVRVGAEHLARAAAELAERRHRRFVVVGGAAEADAPGIAGELAALLPGRRIVAAPVAAGAAGGGADAVRVALASLAERGGAG